tara:strand:- start:83 stop:499 length:417 start_codon:yes stop_codon:yes gene_type:complete
MLLSSLIFVLITGLILFLIKRTFNGFKIEKKQGPFQLNIKSNKIIVLSKKGCPWCDKLDPYLETAKNEYIKILMNDDGTFTFDEKFSQLDQGERASIIEGSRELMKNVGEFFPSIIYNNNKYIIGFPEEEKLNEIFNE